MKLLAFYYLIIYCIYYTYGNDKINLLRQLCDIGHITSGGV